MPKWISLVGACLAALVIPAAQAQQPPVPNLVRIIVPSSPGASTDIFGRAIAQQLAARLGNNVIVENRAGASGMIGASAVAKGPKDGSQILIFSTSLVSAAATMRQTPVDILNDLVPVAGIAENPLVFAVNSQSPIRTPADLVAAARAKPEQITQGTAGVGTTAHIAQLQFESAAKVQLQHIPYKGAALAVVDMLAGNIDLIIATGSTLAAHVKSGKARLIGVASRQPHPAFPGLPTMSTVAPGYEGGLYVVMWVAAGTPPAIIQRYNREFIEIARSKELAEQMHADGAVPLNWTPEQANARIRRDFAAFKKLATEKNIVVE
ncbi:MAG TPA: tripartite tricarboxylate transporter substrate binding protein [Ramlibacter sp.]|nr:tripartite tricarboxylate transporter substrate binding protein [Ramlibacter sp.]